MKYFRFGGQEIIYKTMENQHWQPVTWVPFRKMKNGKVWFDGLSQKVGLSQETEIQRLSAEFLDEMLQVTKTEKAIFFFPPQQMMYLSTILAKMKTPPDAALPEYLLLDSQQRQHISTRSDPHRSNFYIPDWSMLDQGIIGDSELLMKPEKAFYAPVMMLASSLEKQVPTILGRIKQDRTLEFYPQTISLPRQTALGSRPSVLGLVWVWGWGKQLWQWALPYTQLDLKLKEGESFILQQEQQNMQLGIYSDGSNENEAITQLRLCEPIFEIIPKISKPLHG